MVDPITITPAPRFFSTPPTNIRHLVLLAGIHVLISHCSLAIVNLTLSPPLRAHVQVAAAVSCATWILVLALSSNFRLLLSSPPKCVCKYGKLQPLSGPDSNTSQVCIHATVQKRKHLSAEFWSGCILRPIVLILRVFTS